MNTNIKTINAEFPLKAVWVHVTHNKCLWTVRDAVTADKCRLNSCP